MRRVKPGDFAQVDGLHGFFQMRLEVSPQFVRVCLFSCRHGTQREGNRKRLLGDTLEKQGKTVGGGSNGEMKV